MLHCVAVCCSVLQYIAVCCSVLQCVAVCYSVWQYPRTIGRAAIFSRDSVLQCIARVAVRVAVRCSM